MYLDVFSRRWQHNDSYSITRITTGWNFSFNVFKGNCNKKGEPILYACLDHDSINYPQGLGDYLEYLWDQAEENDFSDVQIQSELDNIGLWIQETEKSTPEGIFKEFNS